MQISPRQPPPTPPRGLLSNRQMWMSSWGPDNSKNHIWLPRCRQILQGDQITLTGGVGWFYWEWPQSAAITHINCCLHARFTAHGTNQGGKKQHVTLLSCSTMKCLLTEGRGSLVCHHHLERTPAHTDGSQFRTNPGPGRERRFQVGEVLKAFHWESKVGRRERKQGLRYFLQDCPPTDGPPQVVFLNYPNYIQTSGNWGFDFLYVFSNFHFTGMLRLNQWKQLRNAEHS